MLHDAIPVTFRKISPRLTKVIGTSVSHADMFRLFPSSVLNMQLFLEGVCIWWPMVSYVQSIPAEIISNI